MPNPTLQHDLDNLPTSRSLGHYLGQLGEPLQLETVPTSLKSQIQGVDVMLQL
jgi:hypothetical protein